MGVPRAPTPLYDFRRQARGPGGLFAGGGGGCAHRGALALARRQDVNLLYWRHQGRAYALVGQTDIGYLWGIANDVAWQLDAI